MAKLDFSKRCKASIADSRFHHYQCSRKIWKDDRCKQHHPDTIKEKQEAWKLDFDRKMRRIEIDRQICALEQKCVEFVEVYAKVIGLSAEVVIQEMKTLEDEKKSIVELLKK